MVLMVMYLAEALLFSHHMPVGIWYWFRGFLTLYAITHIGSLQIVEAQELCIIEDHRCILECWR